MRKKLRNIFLAILSGVTVAVSFPTLVGSYLLPDLGILAWVGLVPLFWLLRSSSPKGGFFYTYVFAISCYSLSIWWIFRALNSYGGISVPPAIFITFLLVLITSLYVAFAVFLAIWIVKGVGGELILWIPASWVAFEFLRHWFPFGGFPWAHLAMSQTHFLKVIQIADLVGIFGIIFLILWVNLFVVEIIVRLRGEGVSFFWTKGAITFILIAITLIYGHVRVGQFSIKEDDPAFTIGMIQGNVDQGDKWKADMAEAHLQHYRDESARLLRVPVDLIVWPEASYPYLFRLPFYGVDPKKLGITFSKMGLPYTLLGAVTHGDDNGFRNSALFFDSGGVLKGTYHKAHLVPFGEYLPMRKILFFTDKITSYPMEDMIAGESFEPLSFMGHRVSVLICYEDLFPDLSRKMVRLGSEVLINLTNDAWYGVSSAPYQHLALSVFRAVETKRFLVRATNTGVSAIVSPYGKVLTSSGIFEPAILVSRVSFLKGETPYVKLGDWFAITMSIFLLWGIVRMSLRGLRSRDDRK